MVMNMLYAWKKNYTCSTTNIAAMIYESTYDLQT